MNADKRIHYIGSKIVKLVNEPALCGAPWQRITDLPGKVTCPDCKKLLETAKK